MWRGGVAWLEGRPSEGGRQVLVHAVAGSELVDLVAEDVNVRTRVHEYGGGAYCLGRDRIYAVHFADQLIHASDLDGNERGVFGEPGCRYADLELSRDERWLVAVEEDHRVGSEGPANHLVAFDLDPPGSITRFATENDFVSFPRFAPNGDALAFTAWDHPNMPWSGTRLYRMDWGGEGPTAEPVLLAGGDAESIFQPGWSSRGDLSFLSDRSGWWNLDRIDADGPFENPRALCPRAAEFGMAQWVFGMSTYGELDDGRLLCRYSEGGGDQLAFLDPVSGVLAGLDLPFTGIHGIHCQGARACFIGGSPTEAAAVVELDLDSHEWRIVRSSLREPIDPARVSRPEPITFPSAGGRRAHAYFYPPHNPDYVGLPGEKAPLLVKCHGGPTASTSAVLDPKIQFWTSRGFAVVDVDYAGSTGYGRAYRDLLEEAWGVVDVEDCIHAATWLTENGQVDGDRLAISGGSAGGYTVLCALTFHDVFGAGASHYGIGDLAALEADTHKFESRYTDWLVGRRVDHPKRWRDRSPIHFCHQLSCPVIFFQGLEDEVVPPAQAEAMVEALARRGIPHAYVPFEGEQHGFRRAENIVAALEGELYFYSRVFGFDSDVGPGRVQIVGG